MKGILNDIKIFGKEVFRKSLIRICLVAACFIASGGMLPTAMAATYTCSTITAIQDAMKAAQPGDTILIAPGTYVGDVSTSGNTSGHFYGGNDGTSTAHIVLKSQDPSNQAILKGSAYPSDGYILYITGDYWEIRELTIQYGQKGIVLDSANYALIHHCTVSDVGDEGVHFRDGSSNGLIDSCTVTDTGKGQPGYGEGVYVGSDKGKWTTFKKECDNNIIRNCAIGPGVAAEHVDVKEGTTGTIIEYCTFNGTGIAGQNSADSFVDVKGNNVSVRNNSGYRNGNSSVVDAFQIHEQVAGWSINNEFYNNTVYLDDATPYVVHNTVTANTAYNSAWNNTRNPAGNMYKLMTVKDPTPAPVRTATPGLTKTPTPARTPTPVTTGTPTPVRTPSPTIPAATATPAPITGGIKVQFYNQSTAATTNQIYLNFKLINNGSSPLTLSNVTIRYYYTVNGAQTQNFYCDYTPLGSGNVNGSFATMATAKTGADTYVEIGFGSGAGSLAAGGNTTIQARIAKSNWTNYTQTDDYSFNSSATTFVDWTKVTGYVSGALAWGTEP